LIGNTISVIFLMLSEVQFLVKYIDRRTKL